jgi:hypothetical protein
MTPKSGHLRRLEAVIRGKGAYQYGIAGGTNGTSIDKKVQTKK